MPHRAFVDSRLVAWEVWEVVPEAIERRVRDDRRTDSRPEPDRRAAPVIRCRLGARTVTAWLCFESKAEKRRLAPVPDRWHHLPSVELEGLLARAMPAPHHSQHPRPRPTH